MDSPSPQHPKNQRRKRKDPESRDFTCGCGKSYLSYAAAYTHVKNKHAGDKQMLTNIAKPEREKLKRGRPKEKKVFFITHETEQLSIVEEAILLIHEALRKEETGSNKIVLEGNEEQRPDELVRGYDELKKKIGEPGAEIFFNADVSRGSAEILTKFAQSLNKHFLPQIAIKIIWFMNYLTSTCTNFPSPAKLRISFEKTERLINEPEVQSLWSEHLEVAKIISESLRKWVESWQKSDSHNKSEDEPGF